jgi:hypothetical protein
MGVISVLADLLCPAIPTASSMSASKFPLSKLQHQFGKHVIDSDSGKEVFHAPTAHSLIQAAGYLKHTRAKQQKKGVFFRGQTRLYPSLNPTLLRGIKDGDANAKRRAMLNKFLQQIGDEEQVLTAVDPHCREALLQHYGIRTTWIDVVDNIWVALWFACHDAKSVIRGNEEYLHFEKRIPGTGGNDFAYVLLLESAFFDGVDSELGHYRDSRSETIDLRIAAPSHFVRPHAQHGVLVRRLSKKSQLPLSDCAELHVGTIRVDLAAAIDWLGAGSTLTNHSLFPPAYYDYGYRELLELLKPQNKLLGSVHRIQA